ncbi:MAG: PH domain-containing protein [Nocardioidaceae bacterium]|nr:PH domain-containing protein [Nocardioidaceae bacterium]
MTADHPAPAAPPSGDTPMRRLHPLTPLLRGGIIAVAITVAAGRQLLEGGPVDWPLPIVVAVVAAAAAWAALTWWTTRYQVGSDTLRIESGIVVRRSRRIRLDRVQAVEVQQPLLARVFRMAELQIETAGDGTEATLAYVTLAQAQQLRVELLARAGQLSGRAGQGRAATAREGTESQHQEAAEGVHEVLHRATPGLLLVSQLVRTGPLVALLGAAAAATISVVVGEPLGLALVLPAALAVGNAVWSGFVSHYGFTLTRTARGLAVRAGLLDVRTQSIPTDRVQGVVVVEPMVWRRLGWCEGLVTVAGVGSRSDDTGRLSATLLPVVERDRGARIAIDALAGDIASVPLTGIPHRAMVLAPLTRRVLALGMSAGAPGGPGVVVTRRGWLTRRTDVVPRHKVQSCAVRQGPLQRRLGLATLRLHLPPGPVQAVGLHRDQSEAWRTALTVATTAGASARV